MNEKTTHELIFRESPVESGVMTVTWKMGGAVYTMQEKGFGKLIGINQPGTYRVTVEPVGEEVDMAARLQALLKLTEDTLKLDFEKESGLVLGAVAGIQKLLREALDVSQESESKRRREGEAMSEEIHQTYRLGERQTLRVGTSGPYGFDSHEWRGPGTYRVTVERVEANNPAPPQMEPRAFTFTVKDIAILEVVEPEEVHRLRNLPPGTYQVWCCPVEEPKRVRPYLVSGAQGKNRLLCPECAWLHAHGCYTSCNFCHVPFQGGTPLPWPEPQYEKQP